MFRRFMVSLFVVCLVASVFVASCLGYSSMNSFVPSGSIGSYSEFDDHDVSYAQIFNSTFTGYLYQFVVPMWRNGSVDCDVVAKVQGVDSGTGKPNATIYAISNVVDVSMLIEVDEVNVPFESSEYQWVTFYFGMVQFPVGTLFSVVFYPVNVVTLDGAHSFYWGGVGAGGFSDGYLLWSTDGGSTWSGGTADGYFSALGGATELFSDDGGAVTNLSFDVLSSSLVNWIIYLVVMLLPAFLLGVFFKMGKWGFIIGLAIGAGLGYAFIANFPLYLLVLVAVGEAGLVYSAVSREA